MFHSIVRNTIGEILQNLCLNSIYKIVCLILDDRHTILDGNSLEQLMWSSNFNKYHALCICFAIPHILPIKYSGTRVEYRVLHELCKRVEPHWQIKRA